MTAIAFPAIARKSAAAKAERLAKSMTNDEDVLADFQSGWVSNALAQVEAGLPRIEEAIRELRRAVELANAGDEQSSAEAVEIWKHYGSIVTGLLSAV